MDAIEQEVGEQPAVEVPEQKPEPPVVTDEIKLMLQKEGDRRVSSVAAELKKTRDELEAIKKASMSEAQRSKYEYEQNQARLAEEKEQLASKLALYTTRAEINKRGWSEDIAEFVLSGDETEVRDKADKLQRMIDAEVSKRVSEHLKTAGIAPPNKSASTTAPESVNTDDPIAFARAVRAGKLTL